MAPSELTGAVHDVVADALSQVHYGTGDSLVALLVFCVEECLLRLLHR